VVGNKFQDIILAHSRNTTNVGKPVGAYESSRELNVVCGDEVTVFLQQGAELPKISYDVSGCALCSASASIMAERISDAPLGEGKDLVVRFLNDFPVGRIIDHEGVGIEALFDMRRFPSRERCVLLPWQALLRLLK